MNGCKMDAKGRPSIILWKTSYDWGGHRLSVIDGINSDFFSPQIARLGEVALPLRNAAARASGMVASERHQRIV